MAIETYAIDKKESMSVFRVKNGPKKPCNPKQQQRCIRATPRYCGIKKTSVDS